MRTLAARSPRTRRARSDTARYGPRLFAGAFVFPTRAARVAAPLPAVIGGALRQTAVSAPHDDRIGTIRQNQRKSLTAAFPIDPTRAASRDIAASIRRRRRAPRIVRDIAASPAPAPSGRRVRTFAAPLLATRLNPALLNAQMPIRFQIDTT
ncbi:hypothetical protein [Burkholderia thailandensis]|uniref:hypothetical protein n=1 Tax=Burkholderia thailandensis TaxID=57975 RepID=UPI0004B4D478|nr:hypothetical protein [Burkholderia thailandensis]